jgi:hypothetical protein
MIGSTHLPKKVDPSLISPVKQNQRQCLAIVEFSLEQYVPYAYVKNGQQGTSLSMLPLFVVAEPLYL